MNDQTHRRAIVGVLAAEMYETAGEQWWAVRDLANLDVPALADLVGAGILHSRLCKLGNTLADFRNVQIGEYVLESMRDNRTGAHLYRAVPAPIVCGKVKPHAEHGSIRLELAELREAVIAWQADGTRLVSRFAALEERLRRVNSEDR